MTEPTPLGDVLGDLLAGMGIARPGDAAAILEGWETIAPEPWSSRAAPVAIRNGVLEVTVPDGAVASLLRYQTTQLISHLAQAVGSGLVTDVTITVDRSGARSS